MPRLEGALYQMPGYADGATARRETLCPGREARDLSRCEGPFHILRYRFGTRAEQASSAGEPKHRRSVP